MIPIDYYRQITDDARELDDETIAFVEQFMEFNSLDNYRLTDMLAMFPFSRGFVTIFNDQIAWSYLRHSRAVLRGQYEYDDGYVLVLDQMSKGQVIKTLFGKFLRYESYITFIRETPTPTEKYPTTFAEAAILGGWCMQKLPDDDPREPGDEFELDAIECIEPVGERALRVKWALGDELYVDMVHGGRYFARAMPFWTGRLVWQKMWPWQNTQMKITRTGTRLSLQDRLWSILFKLPYWLTLRRGMSVDYFGLSKKLMKAAIPRAQEIEDHYQQLAKEQGVTLKPFSRALMRRHDALAKKYDW